jgi:hypothetical protein
MSVLTSKLRLLPWPHIFATLFAVTAIGGAVAHATQKAWWPYCKPDQHFIETSVAARMQAAEASLKTNERLEVTTFVIVRASDADGLEVVTGTKWTSMAATAPVRTYCYVALPGQGKQAVVDLADRLGWGSVAYALITADQAGFVKRPVAEVLALAKTHCRWMQERS